MKVRKTKVTQPEIDRIIAVQNSANSLRWGAHECEEGVMFAVGNVHYKGNSHTHYFIVHDDYSVEEIVKRKDINENLKDILVPWTATPDMNGVVNQLILHLKSWFPAKGVSL